MPRVIRTPLAKGDLKGILAYLDPRSPAAAQRLAAAINEKCRHIGRWPMMGRARDELLPGVRSVVVEDTYLIFYRFDDDAVRILRILHGARDIPGSLFADE